MSESLVVMIQTSDNFTLMISPSQLFGAAASPRNSWALYRASRVVSITGPYTGWRAGCIYYLLYLLEGGAALPRLPYRGALTLEAHPRTHSHEQLAYTVGDET